MKQDREMRSCDIDEVKFLVGQTADAGECDDECDHARDQQSRMTIRHLNHAHTQHGHHGRHHQQSFKKLHIRIFASPDMNVNP